MSTSKLSFKYDILYRIGSANCSPTNHTSSVSTVLARLIFVVGTKAKMDFGAYIFEQTIKHATTYAVKLPIAFPCLLTEIILSQHPHILQTNEHEFHKAIPLTFDY